ncbi:hypothetical protein K491DRAFT_216180 [Lophiostoma macrostomum CBS 122681]|uniref:Uncharacterized protein n=1 Tax=Lophiostoma macrostomum CBS 122681 TaxID=1314788 RepID=A0A6A6TJP0_9PLEO|nr:hypothetical protein K491DRAFT_216180 [Lophiostoma macrostomum CBS 122681]
MEISCGHRDFVTSRALSTLCSRACDQAVLNVIPSISRYHIQFTHASNITTDDINDDLPTRLVFLSFQGSRRSLCSKVRVVPFTFLPAPAPARSPIYRPFHISNRRSIPTSLSSPQRARADTAPRRCNAARESFVNYRPTCQARGPDCGTCNSCMAKNGRY